MLYSKNVFINCPFDKEYHTLLRPMIFTLVYLGLNPNIALMDRDCSNGRLEKIVKLIKESKYSIHDLSRMKASEKEEFYRMNMPFELGIDYGIKRSGASNKLNQKKHLILENVKHEYKKAISDIAGWDIEAHRNKAFLVIKILRDWFVDNGATSYTGSPNDIWDKFNYLSNAVWEKMGKKGKVGQACNKMPIGEFIKFTKGWIKTNY